MGFFGKIKNFFTKGVWKDDEQLRIEQESLIERQKLEKEAENLPKNEILTVEDLEKDTIIEKETEKKEDKQKSLLIKEDKAEIEFEDAKEKIKKVKSFKKVEENIRPEGVKKVTIIPTDSLDEVGSVYKELLGDKLLDGNDETKNAILEAAIAGREVLKERFTLTINIDTSVGQSFDIVFFGVLAEHTQPVSTFFYPGQEIQDPDYDLDILISRLHEQLKARGSALNSEPSVGSYPQQKNWKVNNVTTNIDFA